MGRRDQLLKLYLQPNLRNTFDGHPLHYAAGELDGLIKNKEKKGSSWVKLKAFRTIVGRPKILKYST